MKYNIIYIPDDTYGQHMVFTDIEAFKQHMAGCILPPYKCTLTLNGGRHTDFSDAFLYSNKVKVAAKWHKDNQHPIQEVHCTLVKAPLIEKSYLNGG